MSAFQGRFFIQSVGAASVVLSSEKNVSDSGGGVADVRVLTVALNTTPDSAFWGTAASCGRFDVVIRRIS